MKTWIKKTEFEKLIYESEDAEFGEIERIGGSFYRVRREDREPVYYGYDEFDDGEEKIGDINDLKRYRDTRRIKKH